MKCPSCGMYLPGDSLFCQYCGMYLPGDSLFCQYCGERLEDTYAADATEIEKTEEELSSESFPEKPGEENPEPEVFTPEPGKPLYAHENIGQSPAPQGRPDKCRVCGGKIDQRSGRCVVCGEQYFKPEKRRTNTAAAAVIFLILALLLAGLNAYQYFSYNKTLEEKELETLSLTIDKQDAEDKYDEILSFFRSGNAGYAAENFNAGTPVVVLLHEFGSSRQISLTANWPGGGNVTMSNSNKWAAAAEIDDESWQTGTTVTIKPRAEGVSVLTFSNDVDSDTFEVMVIVTY